LPARGQGSLSNPMFAGASVEQFYHRPSVGATLGTPFGFQSAGGPYTTGSASYVPIGLQVRFCSDYVHINLMIVHQTSIIKSVSNNSLSW